MDTTSPAQKPLTAALASLREVYAKDDPQEFLDALTSCSQRDMSHLAWKSLWADAVTWLYGPTSMHASWRDQAGRPTATAMKFWDVQQAVQRAKKGIPLFLDCLSRYARDVEGPACDLVTAAL